MITFNKFSTAIENYSFSQFSRKFYNFPMKFCKAGIENSNCL